jgi:hypothetical protein
MEFLPHIILSSLICPVVCFIIGYLVISRYSWNVLRIPIGMGGLMYPLFFSIFAFFLTIIYEIALPFMLPAAAHSLSWRIGVPTIALIILMFVTCPMDAEGRYLAVLYRRLRDGVPKD